MSRARIKSEFLTTKIQLSLNKQNSRLKSPKCSLDSLLSGELGALNELSRVLTTIAGATQRGKKKGPEVRREAVWDCRIGLSHPQIQIHHLELQLVSVCHVCSH